MKLSSVTCLAFGFLGGALLFSRAPVPGGAVREGPDRGDTALDSALLPRSAAVASPTSQRTALVAPSPLPTPLERIVPTRAASVTDEWHGAIQAWIDDGGLFEVLARHPSGTRDFLFEVAVRRGDADLADRLLDERFDVWDEDVARVAALRREQGDVERATELYLRAFAMDRGESAHVAVVAELAPLRALELFADEQPGDDPERWNPDEIQSLAVLLHRVGRSREAKRYLLAMLERRLLRADGLAVLANIAPSEAEELLLANLIGGGFCGNPHLVARWQLFDFYESTGGQEIVVAQILAELDAGAGLDEDHKRLVRLAPERYAARLQGELEQNGEDGGLWGRLGECQEASGDAVGAVGSFVRALECGEWWWCERAARMAPARVLPLVRDRIAEGDDEDWGRYADLCWKAGWSGEAGLAWQRARELNPSEGIWFDRLERLARDIDPLVEEDDAWWPEWMVFD